jgi:hypothetical protein
MLQLEISIQMKHPNLASIHFNFQHIDISLQYANMQNIITEYLKYRLTVPDS